MKGPFCRVPSEASSLTCALKSVKPTTCKVKVGKSLPARSLKFFAKLCIIQPKPLLFTRSWIQRKVATAPLLYTTLVCILWYTTSTGWSLSPCALLSHTHQDEQHREMCRGKSTLEIFCSIRTIFLLGNSRTWIWVLWSYGRISKAVHRSCKWNEEEEERSWCNFQLPIIWSFSNIWYDHFSWWGTFAPLAWSCSGM